MIRQLTLTSDPVDEAALVGQRSLAPSMGAVTRFAGIVREREDATTIDAIDYEANEPMARHQFGLLFDELERRWPTVDSVRLVHRLGIVPVNQVSLWVEVVAPHRAEAFAACQWLIDEMKRVVPIWKLPLGRT